MCSGRGNTTRPGRYSTVVQPWQITLVWSEEIDHNGDIPGLQSMFVKKGRLVDIIAGQGILTGLRYGGPRKLSKVKHLSGISQ